MYSKKNIANYNVEKDALVYEKELVDILLKGAAELSDDWSTPRVFINEGNCINLTKCEKKSNVKQFAVVCCCKKQGVFLSNSSTSLWKSVAKRGILPYLSKWTVV